MKRISLKYKNLHIKAYESQAEQTYFSTMVNDVFNF